MGTGYLVAGQMTPESLATVQAAEKLLFLVADPATRIWLQGLNPSAESLYDAYGEGRPRRDSYREMVERILAPVRRGLRVCAAFYGHPGVFVFPSHEAIRIARAEGCPAQMLPGISAEDCLFADLGVDPALDGCQSFEASDFLVRRRRFDPTSALVLWQVGAIGVSTFLPRAVWHNEHLPVLVEVLAPHYPPGHQVVLYTASGLPICEPEIERLPLTELPRARVPITATLYVPPRERAPVDPEMARRLGLDHLLP